METSLYLTSDASQGLPWSPIFSLFNYVLFVSLVLVSKSTCQVEETGESNRLCYCHWFAALPDPVVFYEKVTVCAEFGTPYTCALSQTTRYSQQHQIFDRRDGESILSLLFRSVKPVPSRTCQFIITPRILGTPFKPVLSMKYFLHLIAIICIAHACYLYYVA